jgi:phosphate transport system substrate-binding protein
MKIISDKCIIMFVITFYSVICGQTSGKTIKLSGSVPFKEMYFDANQSAIEAKIGCTLEIVANGTDHGVMDLVDGRSNAAMMASPLADIANKLNEKKAGTIDVSLYTESKIGECEIELIVHPSNKLSNITAEQATALLSGKIKNWKDLGGNDQPVIVAVAMPGNGIRTTTEKQLLKKEQFTADARQLTNPAQVAAVVAQLPGGIGPVGKSMLKDGDKVLKITDKQIVAPMIILTKGAPSSDIQKLIEALRFYNKK